MSIKRDATHELIQKLLRSIQDKAPINVEYITEPTSTIITTRIQSLEYYYKKSSIYNYLLKLGVYPIVLFTLVTTSLTFGIKKTYTNNTKLVLNLLGVVYPAWCCWHILKDNSIKGEERLKSWLTYWMIFGSFQVLDHWMTLDLITFSRKKYNLFKLFILYWAQNPHSDGANILYRHVIQKPPVIKQVEKKEELHIKEKEKKEEEEEEEHTIAIGYSYLDGYNPPNLLPSNNSSDDDDSVRDTSNLHTTTIPTHIKSDGEYPLLHTTAVNEPAW